VSIFTYGADFAFYPVPFQITLFFYVILGLFYVCLMFHGQFYLKAIVLGASVSASMLMHFLTGTFVTLITGSFRIFSLETTLGSIILLLLLVLFFIHYAVIPKTQLPSQYGISMAVFMLLMALFTNSITVLSFQFTDRSSRLAIYAFSLGVVLFLYFLFFRIVREYEEKSVYKIMLRQMESQQKYLQESVQTYNEMRCLRHEIKNHVFYMQTLLKQKKLSDLEDYFHQVYHREYAFDMIDSGNDAVNALLSQKRAYAESKNIHVSIQTAIPNSLPIDEADLCAVMSNLLDNAMEACESLPNPSISFAVQQAGQYIHISCKNTVAFDVCKENPDLQTTKQLGNHGVGLRIVREIVEKYDGMMNFNVEDMVFVITLMLKVGADL
jgi:sensor histidine kinase YesM